MFGQYTVGEAVKNGVSLVLTNAFYHGARLIRRPSYIRGKEHLSFGPGLTLGYGCRFDLAGNGITLNIGNDCRMNDRVHIVAHQSVVIGDNVLMASNIFISDTSHGSYSGTHQDAPSTHPNERRLHTDPVIIGNDVWLGEGVVVLPGVSIGDGCVIGANAVVTKNVPSGSMAAGVPARVIKQWNPTSHVWDPVQ